MLEVFSSQFKESIKYGMTYSQFWNDDPQLYYIYEEVYLDKLKEQDTLNWQHAYYIKLGVGSLLEKSIKFPEKPIFYGKPNDKPKDVYEMLDRFKNIVAQVNKNFN